MNKVVIDMTMSLDGFVAAPGQQTLKAGLCDEILATHVRYRVLKA